MAMFMLQRGKQRLWEIQLWRRRNFKSFNEDNKKQKIMMKRTHFAATKRVIIDYSEFCDVVWSAEAKLQPVGQAACGLIFRVNIEMSGAKAPDLQLRSSARQRKCGPCHRELPLPHSI
jgi:hypothetical protein